LRKEVASQPLPMFIDFPHAIHNDEVLAMLHEIDPNMAAIIIYREPCDILLSKHNYRRQSVMIDGPDGDQFVDDKDFTESALHGQLKDIYETQYRFDRNAKRLRSHFKQFHEFTYENLKSDPDEFLAELFEFCAVKPTYKLPDYPVN